MLQMLTLIHTRFSAFAGNRLSFKEEDENVLFFLVYVCVWRKHNAVSDLVSIVQLWHFLVNRRKGVGYN